MTWNPSASLTWNLAPTSTVGTAGDASFTRGADLLASHPGTNSNWISRSIHCQSKLTARPGACQDHVSPLMRFVWFWRLVGLLALRGSP